MQLLVTGGTGFIGSHTVVCLMAAGHDITIVDNLCNSQRNMLQRIHQITGKSPRFIEADVRDRDALRAVFADVPIDAVMHFAGLKAVGESVQKPLAYYDCNIGGALSLCAVMSEFSVKTLIFSSSATVYGDPKSVPIRENFPRSATNPYGASKLMIEDMLTDLSHADPSWRIACLRYFNPVGAHESGLIGELPSGMPNNLVPYIAQVACGQRAHLNVFGNDYPTPDGTGVRDYIHVVDLAEGHKAALDYLQQNTGLLTVNLGTGEGYSVLDMVHAFEVASMRKVPYVFTARRPGDIASCYADSTLALQLLGWRAHRGIADMCRDAWRWQTQLQIA